jgi:hypothetical protein
MTRKRKIEVRVVLGYYGARWHKGKSVLMVVKAANRYAYPVWIYSVKVNLFRESLKEAWMNCCLA